MQNVSLLWDFTKIDFEKLLRDQQCDKQTLMNNEFTNYKLKVNTEMKVAWKSARTF